MQISNHFCVFWVIGSWNRAALALGLRRLSSRATGKAELLFWLAKRERERRRDPRALAREGAQIFSFVYFGEQVPGTTFIVLKQNTAF